MKLEHVIDTPIGWLRLRSSSDATALIAIDFDAAPSAVEAGTPPDVLGQTADELAEYFAGLRTEFTVPIDPAGTPFQQRVWAELRGIQFGETTSYGRIAARLGLTGHGARAVGSANGRNPIPIIVPCHRVIASDGTIAGYAGGIDRKRLLLTLEGVLLA